MSIAVGLYPTLRTFTKVMIYIGCSQVIEHLESLEHLQELNLAENFVRVIENLAPLRNLLRLNLSGNQIQRIPGEISVPLQCILKRIRSNNYLASVTNII